MPTLFTLATLQSLAAMTPTRPQALVTQRVNSLANGSPADPKKKSTNFSIQD